MKLSLCITTFNRYEMTIESFEKVLNDNRIDDIVIIDDFSTDGSYEKLKLLCSNKIRVYQQNANIGMSLNKMNAIKQAKNDWCIIFDSDNIIAPDYLDAFYDYITRPKSNEIIKPSSETIFCPDFAKPDFDYTAYSGQTGRRYDSSNIKHYIKEDRFNCLMNTCNYIVNRDFYLKAYKHNSLHIASDTIWHNYNHLLMGGNFHVVPGMQYFHRVHKDSGFMKGIQYNMKQAEQVRDLIRNL